MENKYSERIALLKSRCVPPPFLNELFGIPWPAGNDFTSDFAAWDQQRRTIPPCPDGLLSRWNAEAFLQDHRLQPLPWAAARLGLKPESLQSLLSLLPSLGLRRKYDLYPGLIDESLGEDLIRSLKGLRFRTFGTHDSFCEQLHAALRQIVSIPIEPWYCATSQAMAEYPILFAYQIDSITFEPLSVKHSIWLDLGKPLNLPPDRVSKLFYVEHRNELRPLIAGRGEPDRLDLYERASGPQGNGLHV